MSLYEFLFCLELPLLESCVLMNCLQNGYYSFFLVGGTGPPTFDPFFLTVLTILQRMYLTSSMIISLRVIPHYF